MFTWSKNIKLLFNYGLGPVLFIWLSFSIYDQVKNQPHLHDTLHNLRQSATGAQSWIIYMALLLVLLNWGIEARKWQVLVKQLEEISFLHAFKAVLAGLAFAMNTPNRIGEYGGRMLYIQEGHRWKAFSLTVLGSFSQLIVTMLIGLGGLVFLLTNTVTAYGIAAYHIWIQVLFSGTLIVTILLVLLYFRVGKLLQWAEKIPGARSLLKHITVIEDIPVTILLRTISLSFIRYMVFAFQYILLLQLYMVDVPVWHSFWLISVLYLILAVIPTIALAEAGIRGQVSLLLFMLVNTNKFGITAAATSIWFINLVIPALAGSLLFLSLKIFSDK